MGTQGPGSEVHATFGQQRAASHFQPFVSQKSQVAMADSEPPAAEETPSSINDNDNSTAVVVNEADNDKVVHGQTDANDDDAMSVADAAAVATAVPDEDTPSSALAAEVPAEAVVPEAVATVEAAEAQVPAGGSPAAASTPEPPTPTPATIVAPQRAQAARDAYRMLVDMVPCLPIAVGSGNSSHGNTTAATTDTANASSSTMTLRRLGRICSNRSTFASPAALYPIGFAADVYTVSPVHGRMLKLRAAILDGRELNDSLQSQNAQSTTDAATATQSRTVYPDGPVFRISWGLGVDAEPDGGIEYPYDPQDDYDQGKVGLLDDTIMDDMDDNDNGDSMDDDDILSDDNSYGSGLLKKRNRHRKRKTTANSNIPPQAQMRVKVRFVDNQWHDGMIAKVVENTSIDKNDNSTNNNTKKTWNLDIAYDDGSTERIAYPDPDVQLAKPGIEPLVDRHGNVELTEMDGRSVTSVVGFSPLQVWGRTLEQLGLVDEIMVEQAVARLEAARAESRQQAQDRLNKAASTSTPRKKSIESPSAASADGGTPDSPSSAMAGSEEGSPSKVAAATATAEDSAADAVPSSATPDAAAEPVDDREPPTEAETELREELAALEEEFAAAKRADDDAIQALAEARIQCTGALLCNPFMDKAQQASWLATVVRKEKSRMGSTGNKRKVVTAMDLLERNDTLYTPDVEALLEGLPGSEYCDSYVYQVFRGAGALSRTWIHDLQLRQEKEAAARSKRTRESEARQEQEQDRLRKRRKREEARDEKKRQKLEEEDQKKQVRTADRLERLRVQVDERLSKEAGFQRERALLVLAKSVTKEFSRRRKAAELVAAHHVVVEESHGNSNSNNKNASAAAMVPANGGRPAVAPPAPVLPVGLAKPFDEDAVRVWNFMSTFGSFFIERGFLQQIPTLESLQGAVDCLRGPSNRSGMGMDDAVNSLTQLAVALCKPLAATLTRVLFASLIALNPVLQRDFGAAFFNEVNATQAAKEKKAAEETNEEPNSGATGDAEALANPEDILLPVNELTWQEIARVSFLSDALGDLGFSRHEAAHLLRGYRSAGHPNSKEARRLRKSEDYTIALLRQEIRKSTDPADTQEESPAKEPSAPIRVRAPCQPVAHPPDFLFYLHNIQSIPPSDAGPIRKNLDLAVQAVESATTSVGGLDELKQAHELMKKIPVSDHLSKSDVKSVENVQTMCENVIQQQSGNEDSQAFSDKARKGELGDRQWPWQTSKEVMLVEPDGSKRPATRQTMGLLDTLSIDVVELKQRKHLREQYMEDALRLKEDMDRQAQPGEEDDDDDDDDEEEENPVAQPDETPKPEGGDETAVKEEEKTVEAEKLGKPTPYDDFCADMPDAPELIRRCLSVLRTLSNSEPAEPFLYPVDPQNNPGYYDMVLRPMCLREVGRLLGVAAKDAAREPEKASQIEEDAVIEFGRNIRLIAQNCLAYTNAGPTVISAGTELIRIFERLLLDWVIAPTEHLPPLVELDDGLCVDHHPSDAQATVLLCDGCDGKYNISRLNPPLLSIPKDDWYCPRCVGCRWWGTLDPRVGITFQNGDKNLRVSSCQRRFPEGSDKATLVYEVLDEKSQSEMWTLDYIDAKLKTAGKSVPAIRCLQAVVESTGYGLGADGRIVDDIIPVALNPTVSDAAAHVATTSTLFRDTIHASATLLVIDPKEMNATEWLRLLVLLTMKCSSSDIISNVVAEMEGAAAEKMAEARSALSKVTSVADVLSGADPSDDPPKEEVAVAVEDTSTSIAKPVDNKLASAQMSSGKVAVVEASAVEVVDEMDVEVIPDDKAVVSKATEVVPEIPPAPDIHTLVKKAKNRRDKKVEDTFIGHTIKSQLRPVVASFEEDQVSHVVESTFSKSPDIQFSKLRCRRMVCHYCGLTDVALGSPLVRVPSEKEWEEILPSALEGKRTRLIAEVPTKTGLPRLASVSIRVGDELISESEPTYTKLEDCGMLQFCPRAEAGFQADLDFKDEHDLPFVTGSWSSHECCAVAAHNARKDRLVEDFRTRQGVRIEKEASMTCGRTLELGRDSSGRSYWKFVGDAEALFVCTTTPATTTSETASDSDDGDGGATTSWQRFGDSASIAGVIVALGKDSVAQDLMHSFREAAAIVKDGTWSSHLLLKKYPRTAKLLKDAPAGVSDADTAMDDDNEESDVAMEEVIEVEGGFEPYHEGEHVLVESRSGDLFWDARVEAVSVCNVFTAPAPTDGSAAAPKKLIDAYQVRYDVNGGGEGAPWSTRFVEWVQPNRVIEPTEHNRLLQDETLADLHATSGGLPPELNILIAKDFLHARDRARGNRSLPDFVRLLQKRATSGTQGGELWSSNFRIFAVAKAGLLAVEAALPIGSLDHTDKGAWRRTFADRWRRRVVGAESPMQLLRCVVHLEDTITEEWIKPEAMHARSCLPSRWKALGEASAAGVSLRILLLDRSIRYETLDRKRFSCKKKK